MVLPIHAVPTVRQPGELLPGCRAGGEGFGDLLGSPDARAVHRREDRQLRVVEIDEQGAPQSVWRAGQPTEPDTRSAPGEQPGDRVDRDKLLQQIGDGGCGTVWMAEQLEPVRRKAAPHSRASKRLLVVRDPGAWLRQGALRCVRQGRRGGVRTAVRLAARGYPRRILT